MKQPTHSVLQCVKPLNLYSDLCGITQTKTRVLQSKAKPIIEVKRADLLLMLDHFSTLENVLIML